MKTTNIYSNTPERTAAFRQMALAPNEDIPIFEMNDTTARDLNVIWSSVEDLATRWRGGRDARIIDKPTNRQEFWGAFAAENVTPHLPVAKEFIEKSTGLDKTAIDLGCGNSQTTRLLLERGWKVTAIDSSRPTLEIVKSKNEKEFKSRQLTLIKTDATTFVPKEPVDLVIASDVLPYTDPSKFQDSWTKIHDTFIKEDGFLIGTLFIVPTEPESIPHINVMKEFGGWALPDRRMVRALLTQTGYEVQTCRYRKDLDLEPMAVQFVAQKKTP
ncbi:MAG: class I SAM-dependent methyltransferase [Chlamydiota bacterium]